MTDAYTRYETGVRALLARLGRDHPRTADVQVCQQRLADNLAAARRHDDTEARRVERAEIIERLNALSQASLGVSFNALCDASKMPSGEAPPAQPITYVNTGGGAYVGGNVTVEGGDFVGRDMHTSPAPRTAPDSLLTYAPLLIWADPPRPLPLRAPHNRACAIRQLQAAHADLPPLPFDVVALPPICLLSLDPTDRAEQAWAAAEREVAVILARRDVPPQAGTSLLKLAGDLASRTGLWLGWDDVRDARNDPDKAHLLEEARRHAQDNAVVVLAPCPDEAFSCLWRLLQPVVATAQQAYAIGPAAYDWPAPLEHAGAEPERVLDLVPIIEAPASAPPAPAPTLCGADQEIVQRLERLLHGQEDLRRGQIAIARRLTVPEQHQVAELRNAVITLQHANATALGELQRMVDSLRRALIDIRDRQIASIDEDVGRILHEVTEVLEADVGISTELQLLIPFLPFLVKVDLGSNVAVRQLVENLIAHIRKHSKR